MDNLAELLELVDELHRNNAMHIRRGFRLQDADVMVCTNHLIEEVVELQAECITQNREAIIEEASDVMAIFLHLLHMHGVALETVVDMCHSKLRNNFTYDENKLATETPGFTRRNRE